MRGGVEFVKEIPKNPSGKILHHALKDQFKAKNIKSKIWTNVTNVSICQLSNIYFGKENKKFLLSLNDILSYYCAAKVLSEPPNHLLTEKGQMSPQFLPDHVWLIAGCCRFDHCIMQPHRPYQCHFIFLIPFEPSALQSCIIYHWADCLNNWAFNVIWSQVVLNFPPTSHWLCTGTLLFIPKQSDMF